MSFEAKPYDAASSTADSDAELQRRFSASLVGQHVPSLRHVKVEARQGTIVLRGEVSSFYAKQLLQHSARRIAGDSPVIDEVSVVTPAAFRDPLRLRTTATAGVALLLAALSIGCSKPGIAQVPVVPVTGQLTFEGQSTAGAIIVFWPKNKNLGFPSPRATADAQGNFTLTTYSTADGAPIGEYVVTVELRKPVLNGVGEYVEGENAIPEQYSQERTSKLVATVVDGPNTVPLKIVR